MVTEPQLHRWADNAEGALAWRWQPAMRVLSSAPVGGGWRWADWLLNVGVPLRYARTDLAEHLAEIAAELDLDGQGVGLFTAAEVGDVQRGRDEGIVVDATVGISKPTLAADPSDGYTPWRPGTINIVAQLPVTLEPAAAVNAVITMTEAKTQALQEAGVPGTGTASDAVVVAWPAVSEPGGEMERFAGPRSRWGGRLARATHAAVAAGIDNWRP